MEQGERCDAHNCARLPSGVIRRANRRVPGTPVDRGPRAVVCRRWLETPGAARPRSHDEWLRVCYGNGARLFRVSAADQAT